jgi:threonine/homoserine/homoserine lactone efflux protein
VEELLGFVLAGFALAGSPGPNTLSLAATGAAFGARNGIGYMAGLAVGMIVVMAVTGTGAMSILLALPAATPIVTVIVAAYFVYLAFRIATAPPLAELPDERRKPSFAAGLLLSLVNPKAYAAMAALFSGFELVKGRFALDIAAKVAVTTVIVVVVNIAWLLAGTALTRFLREPTANRIINVTFAVLLLASVAFAFLV